jgi:MEMO1 family protein
VAGQFYPSESEELYEMIHRCFTHPIGPGKFPSSTASKKSETEISRVECVLVPHAGYIYSGPVAAHSYEVAFDFFQKFAQEDQIAVIILGPNHYGIGSGVAVSDASAWRTPLGEVTVAGDLRKKITSKSSIIDIDDTAHSREHSIEVQIPFVQAISGSLIEKISILPICLMLQDLDTATEVGDELFSLVDQSELPFLIIGSSDLTHYETHKTASAKDHELLAEVDRLQLSSFYRVLERRNISSCGYGAIAATMQVSRKLNKRKGQLLKYATSGDTSDNFSSVVGYPSVHFS